jgi:hypothetical protein
MLTEPEESSDYELSLVLHRFGHFKQTTETVAFGLLGIAHAWVPCHLGLRCDL